MGPLIPAKSERSSSHLRHRAFWFVLSVSSNLYGSQFSQSIISDRVYSESFSISSFGSCKIGSGGSAVNNQNEAMQIGR